MADVEVASKAPTRGPRDDRGRRDRAQFVDTLLFLIVAVEADAGTGAAAAVPLAHQLAIVGGTLAGGALVDRIGARVVVISGLAVSASAMRCSRRRARRVLLGALGSLVLGLLSTTIRLSLTQPVGCPCGALLCRCVEHGDCASPAHFKVHAASLESHRPGALVDSG